MSHVGPLGDVWLRLLSGPLTMARQSSHFVLRGCPLPSLSWTKSGFYLPGGPRAPREMPSSLPWSAQFTDPGHSLHCPVRGGPAVSPSFLLPCQGPEDTPSAGCPTCDTSHPAPLSPVAPGVML